MTNPYELLIGLLRRPSDHQKKSRKEQYLETLRTNRVLRKRLRKQEILKAGCDMGNAQALIRRAERRLTGHIATPLHATVMVEPISPTSTPSH
jgi:hypothetical protein